MDLTTHQKTKKYIIYCLILSLCALLQNVPGLLLQIGTARCFLLIPAVLIISLGEDEKASGLLGLFAGCLWDINSAKHMGFNCIFFMFVCFFAAEGISHILRNTFVTNMIATIFAIFLYCIIYWLFFIVFAKIENANDSIFSFYLPCAIYTSVLTPILWLILVPLKKKLNGGQRSA